MFRKVTSAFIILAVIVGSLCACGKKEEVNFLIPIQSDPMCLDPQIADTDSARLVISNCFEGLVRLNEKYEIVPGVAEKWDVSADGLTYTFHLRTDSKWQLLKSYKDVLPDENYMDNFKTTVTANDFVFALKRAVDPITESADAEKLFCISNAQAINSGSADTSALGVSAADDSTLIIKLSRANPDFLRILSLPVCMPCNEEFFNATHAKYGLELKYTFCNGPFYLAKWAEDNSLSMLRNEGYKGNSAVTPSGIYLYINTDEQSVISKLKQHSYDFSFLSDAAHTELAENKKITQISSSTIVSGLCFNCADTLLKNSDIRKAIVMMTKFDEFTKTESSVSQASGIVPECCRFGNEQYRKSAGKISGMKYDEAAAVAAWKKALNTLEQESADITIKCTAETAPQMQHAIQNWQKLLGTMIVAKVEVISQSDLDTAVSNGDYQIAVSSVKAESSTVTDILKYFTVDNDKNIFNYSSQTYDSIVNDIINNESGDNILKKCAQAEQYLESDAVFCPLYNFAEYAAVGKNVTGVFTLPAFESIYFSLGGLS